MKRIGWILLLLAAAGLTAAERENREKIEKTVLVPDPSPEFRVVVDNVFGAVTVKGVQGDRVNAVIEKRIWARSDEQYRNAVEQVRLDVIEESGVIEFYVDGPFRDSHEKREDRSWNPHRYTVTFDFTLEVPRDVSVEIRTVNDGEIAVENVRGDFDIHNVNGGIVLESMAGSGEAVTVNGPVTCSFDVNPKSDCSFRSINGDIRLSFREPLSADVTFETMNGEMYSDFDVVQVPDSRFEKTKKGRRTVYKARHPVKLRVGDGGPVIAASGINGDMFVLKND